MKTPDNPDVTANPQTPNASAPVSGWDRVRSKQPMKTAEEWYSDGWLNNDAVEILHRREIQADALRHAARMCREHGGISIMAAGWIDRVAEQLENASERNSAGEPPPPENPKR